MGKVVGSFPEGLVFPNITSDNEFPNSWPGNQHCKTALTSSIQGISQGAPVFKTTTVFLFNWHTFFINSSWFEGKSSEDLSFPSVSQSEFVPAIKITASASLARDSASSIKSNWSGACMPIWTAGNLPSHLYSTSKE